MRRLEENELVWGWERNNPDVETQLVFKQLIGLLNFAISYPETSVMVSQPVEIRVKVRDPDSGNQLVNNHRGELALFVSTAVESEEDGDGDVPMNEQQVEKILAQKSDQDGVFSMTYTPQSTGVYHMMMRFNGFPLQDRVYRLQVTNKKKKIRKFPKIKKGESMEKQVADSKKGKRQSWYMKR